MDITEIWKPQAGPQLMATLCPVRMVLFGGSRGGGKASSNDAKLLTNSGWRYFSEVRVGDKIVDPETGGTQDVLGVFPQGEKDLYSVVMEDGGSTLVTSDHLWTYRSLPSSKLETARTHSLQSCLGEGRKVFLPVYLDFSSSRAVRSIEFSHRGEATCISVSATHGLYVTDDYIVTHNTDCAIGKQIYGAMRYGSDWNGLFIRKNYKYFADIRRRLQQLIRAGLPAELVGPAQGTNYLRFQNGANVTLTVIESLEKAEFFQGQSFQLVVIEEACQFSYIDPMIEMLKGCLRSAAGVPTSMFLTANPGGSGHSQVRSRFMPEGSKPGQIIDDGFGMQSVFIASSVEDNKILCENDPEYVNLLRSIKDPILRRAWLEGDWDVVLGGFFGDVWNKFKHVVPDFRPPGHWPRIVGMDWGSSTPFSIGWYCVADGETSVSLAGVSRVFPKGALIRFHEWYGCPRNSVTGRIEANVGLRMASEDVASRMVDLEQRMPWLLGTTTRIDRIADPSIFAEKDGPSIAEKMAMKGIVWRKGENKRISGWDTMRKLLQGRVISRTYRDMEDGTREVESEQREPMLYFTEGCTHMVRTLPEVERDLLNIEDVDDSGEDHACLSLGTKLWLNGRVRRLGDILGQGGQVLNRFGLEEPATGVQITRRNASVVELVFNGSREVCTPDHRWLCVNNEWKEARNLRPGDLLARNGCGPAKVLGVFPLENKEDVACMYVPRTHSFVLASGLVSRNCDECRYVCMSRPSTGVLLRDTEKPGVMTENERDFMDAIQGSNTAGIENLSLPRSADTGFGVSSVRGLMLHIAR